MSYILDALKKASAEREQARGVPPGLATQPVRTLSSAPVQMGAALDQRHALVLALLAAVLLCAMTLGALFWPQAEPLPSPIPALLPAQQTIAGAAPLVDGNTSNTSQTSQTSQTSPLSTAVAIGTPATPPPAVRVTPDPSGLPLPTPPRPTAALSPPARAEFPGVLPRPRPAPTLSTLSVLPTSPAPLPMPANVRAALVPLVISGSTYSDNPAFRMLILNGQVYREGEFPAPDLKLEQIRQKSALVSFQGNTYVLPY